MKKENKFREIKDRITKSKPGSVFVASDFIDIAKPETINTILARLAQESILRRIKWGLYEFPEYNDFLGEYIAPSPDEIAHAIGRNFGWKIAPSGDNALNQLGLSTQVPVALTYACNGTYKEYEFGKIKIKFNRATNNDFAGGNEKTTLVIQALKALGRKNINDKIINIISAAFSRDELKSISSDAQHSAAWIGECLTAAYERGIQIEDYCETA